MTHSSTPSAAPLGLGLHLERTALAWRRTTLAMLVAGAVGGRVLAAHGPLWLVLPLAVSLCGGAVAAMAAARRCSRAAEALRTAPDEREAAAQLPGGRLLAVVAGGHALAGVVILTLLI